MLIEQGAFRKMGRFYSTCFSFQILTQLSMTFTGPYAIISGDED